MSDRTGVTGVILAAGFSRRLGRPKQLLPVDGKPLLQFAIDAALAADLAEVILVLGVAAPEILEQVDLGRSQVVVNERAIGGQSSSIVAGMAAAHANRSGTLLMIGDQPDLMSDDLNRVLAAFDGGAESLVAASWQGAIRSPVVFGRAYDDQLRALTGDRGARPLMMTHRDRIVQAMLDRPVPPDIDTEEDYQLFLRNRLADS
jgi:molybdenum cofactor cytidylyltransferase